MANPILEVDRVSRTFGGVRAVNAVSLSVGEGELHAIIGSNGAGKTTLFNLISGGVRVQGGRVAFKGADITNWPPHRLCRLGMGRTFQINNVFAAATVRDNIRLALLSYYRRSWGMLRAARDMFLAETVEIASLVDLERVLERRASELAYGDRRRLELSIALAGKPDLLLLDEPTCGVAVAERPSLMRLVQDVIRQRNMTALLIEHDMDIVFSVADRIAVMHKGEVVANDTPDAIHANPNVRAIYLGEAFDA